MPIACLARRHINGELRVGLNVVYGGGGMGMGCRSDTRYTHPLGKKDGDLVRVECNTWYTCRSWQDSDAPNSPSNAAVSRRTVRSARRSR